MARLYCSPRSIRSCSLARSLSIATRGTSMYNVIPITAAIRKTSSRAKPRSLRRPRLRRTTSILRKTERLLSLRLHVFQHDRVGANPDHAPTALHRHAFRSQDDVLAVEEESGALVVDPLGGKSVVLKRWRRRRRLDFRLFGRLGPVGLRIDDRLAHRNHRFGSLKRCGLYRRGAELKQIPLPSLRLHLLNLREQLEMNRRVDLVGIDLLLVGARIFLAQDGMKLVATSVA